MHPGFSGSVGGQHQRDAFEHPVKARHFAFQMFLSRRRDAVGPHPAIGGRNLPFRLDQTFFQHPLECGIERTLLNLEQVVRPLLDVLDQGVAMHWLPSQGLEDHDFERAGEEVAGRGFGIGFEWRGHKAGFSTQAIS